MHLSEAIEGFLLSKTADGRSPKTIAMYRANLTRLLRYFGDVDINHLATSELRAYYASLGEGERPLGPRSRQIIHIQTGAFFGWLWQEQYIHFRPDDNIKMPRAPEPAIQPFREDEVRRMLKASAYIHIRSDKRDYSYRHPFGTRNRAILLTLLSTGCRAGELCHLNIADVNLETGEVHIRAHKTPFPRTTYLDNAARKSLWKYLTERGENHPGEPLFLSDDRERMTAHGLYMLVKLIGERAKVPNAHPHRYRHTMAVQWIVNGGDLARLRIVLGHRSIVVTQRYLQIAQPDIAKAHAATSAGDKWRL